MRIPVKCLIVDDRAENLLALCNLMRRDDVELLEASSGEEALDVLLSHEVALALLDVQMPIMDGFELAELMRGSERTRHIPIIFITAGAHDQHRVFKGYESGAVDFLYKPIDPQILRNKADVFFQLHRQRVQLAQELRDRTETLRLNEMFTAVLGHDLRTPLNTILTGAQLLEHRSQDDVTRKASASMVSSARRMSRMIEDMLDLARARLAGGIPLRRERTDFAALVRRAVHEYQTGFPERQIEFFFEGDVVGDWDGDRLTQVVSNLIGNALQHGDPGGPVEIQLQVASANEVVLSVTNAGCIPPDLLPHVFDPFRGGQRPLTRSEGLGLGLYIVQQIVQAHGGTVGAQCGATQTAFHIRMPRQSVEIVKL
jgi:signal transduction histidine kinase